MIIRLRSLALAALLSLTLAADLPDPSLPVSSLIASANALLAQGDMHGALDHFDAAIKKDPSNYLTIFKRGATYLSLGKSSQASADFDAVLSLKPDFEAALLQRAKLHARSGDWDAARRDYRAAGRVEEVVELEAAEKAVVGATEAEKVGDWETCVQDAGTAIMVAQGMASLRSLRARCRLARGEVHEAVGDLTHAAQLNPRDLTPHIQIASLLYFSTNNYDRAVTQLRKCLHSDPDSKPCARLYRRLKALHKSTTTLTTLREKRQFSTAAKLLTDPDGLLAQITTETDLLRSTNLLTPPCPQDLLSSLLDATCDIYTEMNSLKRGRPYCDDALRLNPTSLPALLASASRLLSDDDFEAAIRVLDTAKESHPSDPRPQQRLQEAHTLLRRSRTKDYYKVLGLTRDASDREIKKSYRRMTKLYHPDKYRGDLGKDEVEKKMASINEAYEVLSNPELKERFDRGDDPNSQEGQNPFAQGGHPFAGFQGHQQFFRQQGGGGGGGGPFGGGPFGGGQFKFQF